MYQACRHIKPSGLRCKSPAMREHLFCYFHARVHTRVSHTDLRGLNFPVPEDFAAIQESIAKVFDGILSDRIDPKQSSLILRGLQIAMQTIPRTPVPTTESVQEVTLSKKGDRLAPPLEVDPLALENGNSVKALPARTGIESTSTSANLPRLENVRAEILGSVQQGQLVIGSDKLLRCLDKPDDPD